jgi:hypothetical protein
MRRVIAIAVIIMIVAGTVVLAAPDQQTNAFQLFILEARTDLEMMANEFWGIGERSDTWTFNLDLQSDTVVIDLWFDNEQLAEEVFRDEYGEGGRPPGWFGATTVDYVLIARNIRHDLEITAEKVFERFGDGWRPEEWSGAPALYNCDRTVQNTKRLMDVLHNAPTTTVYSAVDYCDVITYELEDDVLPLIYMVLEDDSELPANLLSVRGDLERLRDELLGLGEVPDPETFGEWKGLLDEESPTLVDDIYADMDILADKELGLSIRPEEGWTSIIPDSKAITYRNIRYNLENLAEATYGVDHGDGTRPHGWQGLETPLTRCTRLEQGLVLLMQQRYEFVIDPALAESEHFCEAVVLAANNLAENPPIPDDEEDISNELYTAASENAFSYLDARAWEYMGTMPSGVEFRAWYRNFGESNMMFVTGEDFALFIDHRWTSMEDDLFFTLPTLENAIFKTFCDSYWCNGPSPTPTPTSGGPLLLVINNATPFSTPLVFTDDRGEKTQVSWNHVYVNYLLDRPETGTVQVTLQICADPTLVNCEGVNSVYDSLRGGPMPVISQYNGLNVFEFRYGYIDTVVLESALYFSPDVWISDPTIR